MSAEPLSRLGPPWELLSPRARQVLDVIEELFITEGFAAFTLTQLAVRVGCSRRTLYELAPDKQHLLMFVIDRRYGRLGQLARQRVSEADNPRDKLHAMLTTEVISMRATSSAFRRDAAANPAVREMVYAHSRIGVTMMSRVIEDGIGSGAFRAIEPTFVAEMIDAMMARLYEPEMDSHEHLDFAGRVLAMAALLETGLCT